MDYSNLRSQFNDFYKKHAHSDVVDAGWLGKGLSPDEIISAEKEIIRGGGEIINPERVLNYALPEDIKLISSEISSFAYETPYFMGEHSPVEMYPSLRDFIKDGYSDLQIQTVSSILEWGRDDFGFLWEAELQLANALVEDGHLVKIIQIGEISLDNIINMEVVPIGFSNWGTLYINLYDRNKNVGSVVNFISNDDVIVVQTLSNGYESFVAKMMSSLEMSL
ncbi:hypothetical protein FACS1894116_12760 [Betaproteobacteria bacterium]|nr:hypothetical protein FACS1894116_12760 [Betaproteobacteria bacterium]GHT99605.1 hypothetical protein FACS1894154_07010 [Betaproteobacteria bacterium]GHU23665.1 hypothetical protein FACS189488_06710 [Betaproteobacteria bacterium]GHU30220.1 hypothetical protein FACS189497_09630 [Betaproteobacteria bacterium]